MNRKVAKELLPIIQAYAEGKTIQFRAHINDEWRDVKELGLNGFTGEYRIKPELKYRPFETKEECWQEMHKHPDFGWVRFKETSEYLPIEKVSDFTNYADIFEEYEFTDREPFGVKEE